MANQPAGKAPSDSPALKPYRGKPAVRNFRGGNGNVGIIRSPVRAIALPDRQRARTDLCGVVSRTRSLERDAVSEMKEDPSEPACRSRLQTAVSCCRPMTVVVNVTEKA
jgi:hypothetical protein